MEPTREPTRHTPPPLERDIPPNLKCNDKERRLFLDIADRSRYELLSRYRGVLLACETHVMRAADAINVDDEAP